jgi:hypothetical protein
MNSFTFIRKLLAFQDSRLREPASRPLPDVFLDADALKTQFPGFFQGQKRPDIYKSIKFMFEFR